MKAPPFEYVRASSVEEAVAVLAAHGGEARILAGGQSLMPMMNFRLAAPAVLVDINGLAGLDRIELDGDVLRIGALARHAAVARSPLVAEHAPPVAAAMPHIAHPAIRNRGTFGGSVALADPAAELPACVVALGGTILARGPAGARRIPADDFFLGPFETALAPDEMVTAVELPRLPAGTRWAFDELARRHGDYAMAGLVLAGPRAVFFAVAGRPTRVAAAEAALAAGDAAGAVAAVERHLAADGDLNASAALKRHYAKVLLSRALAPERLAA